MARIQASGKKTFYDTGPAYEDARTIYHSTRVGLNWSSRLDTTARVFELLAFGLPAVLNRVPDLVDMFVDGQDFVGFDSQDEAMIGIDGLLSKPDRAAEIAKAGLEAVKKHTWDARMAEVLSVVRARL
jgi:spore maturation protein CgeB